MSNGCVLVIGLDGATFTVLRPLLEEGKLPNLAKIKEGGASGVLMSTVPPLSGPAWTSFFTGLNPGKHGVFSWRRDPRSRDSKNLVDSRTVLGEKVWDLFGSSGKKSLVMGLPVTYPPSEIEGVIVSGILTPLDAKVFTHPPELSEELRAIGYRTDYALKNDEYDGRDETRRALYEEIKDLARSRMKAIELLVDREQWSLFIVMFGQTDQVQHFLWDDKEVLAEFFGIMDDYIGLLTKMFSERFDPLHVIIMSDHGFDDAPTKSFGMNAWLDGQGLVSQDEKEAKSTMFEIARKVGRGLKKVGIDLGKTRLGKKRFDDQTKKVLEKKLVVLEGHGLYIDREQAGDGANEMIEDLAKGLRNVKDPDGKKVFQAVYKKEEIYQGDGEGMALAPDVVFVPDPGYYIDPGLLATEVFTDLKPDQGRTNWTGMHNGSPEGILYLQGPGIKKGATIDDAKIMDLAPTILHLAGLGVPREMDGKVLEITFEPAFLEERPVRCTHGGHDPGRRDKHQFSEAEAKDVERRLKGLGYLD